MPKKRYHNLPDAGERNVNWAAIKQLMRETRLVQKSVRNEDITWNNSAQLASTLNTIKTNYITWIGHATYLMRLNGKTCVIDPFFSERASPVQFMGPKRLVPPAISLQQLPAIDLVLITHNHYDHLDKKSVIYLAKNHKPLFIVPEGLARTLNKWGITNITELAWDQQHHIHDITITALPAYHYSRRHLFDFNTSWWCSFAIEWGNLKLYHSGDTGYGQHFKVIGEQFNYFDYAMLGIGAYSPQLIMKPVHITPEEAIQIAQDIRAKTILPMHWGTIPLTPEPFAEPMQRLQQGIHALAEPIAIQLPQIGDLLSL